MFKNNICKIFWVTCFLVLLSCSYVNAYNEPYPTPTLSREKINLLFKQAKHRFDRRWNNFVKNRTFDDFNPNFSDQQILQKFDTIVANRNAQYYENPGQQPLRSNYRFERSQELLERGFYKAPHLIAFAYNRSQANYNSSNVTLNGHRFLALEGPQKPRHTNNFLYLLVNYNVNKVIRLTNDIEKGVFKSENYWKNNTHFDKKTGKHYLTYNLKEEENTKPYSFRYYAVDHWGDNTGTDPKFLLNFVNSVRKDYKKGEIIAVHCSAGVGRTGTFIAAFLMLDEIDNQIKSGIAKKDIKLSIEEIVYKLSLQRAYLVGEASQYLTLHKLAKQYLDV